MAVQIPLPDTDARSPQGQIKALFAFPQGCFGSLTLLVGMPQALPPGEESSAQGQHQKAACQANHGPPGRGHQFIEVAQQH